MRVSFIDGHIDEPKITCEDCIHYDICVFHTKGNENEKCAHFKNKADVVEVVRCKDCKYCNKYAKWNGTDYCGCNFNVADIYEIEPTHFCSYGEKRSEGEREKTLPIINRQKAEIERLQKEQDLFADIGKMHSEIKAEAVKEFAERIEQIDVSESDEYIMVKKYKFDNLLKETVGDADGKREEKIP